MFLMRIIGPVITFVDRPWKVCTVCFANVRSEVLNLPSKMYPVGFLFGLGTTERRFRGFGG